MCYAPGRSAAGALFQKQDAVRVSQGPDESSRQGAGRGAGVRSQTSSEQRCPGFALPNPLPALVLSTAKWIPEWDWNRGVA